MLLCTLMAFGQKSSFEEITFNAPKGWSEDKIENGIAFKSTDEAKKTFCVLILHSTLASSGDRKKDFAVAWKKYVVEPFGVTNNNPELEDQKVGSNQLLSGADLIKTEELQALVILSTITTKGRVVPILALMNDAKYAEEADKFISSVSIDTDKKSDSSKLSSPGSNIANATYKGSGAVSDYEFVSPKGWVVTKTASEITLKHQGGAGTSVISMLPMINSTASAEATARSQFWRIFEGWEPFVDLGFTADYGTYERGKTSQGLEYFQLTRYTQKKGNAEVKNDMTVCVIKVGDKAIVLAGAQAFQNIDDPVIHCLDYLLYSFAVKGVGAADFGKSLLGSWSTAGSSVALGYTFFSNGTFAFGGASSSRTSKTETIDLVTTTSFNSDGTFLLKGNILTTTIKKSGNVSKARIRFFDRKFDKSDWTSHLGKLDLSQEEADRTVTLSRDK